MRSNFLNTSPFSLVQSTRDRCSIANNVQLSQLMALCHSKSKDITTCQVFMQFHTSINTHSRSNISRVIVLLVRIGLECLHCRIWPSEDSRKSHGRRHRLCKQGMRDKMKSLTLPPKMASQSISKILLGGTMNPPNS